MNPEPATPDSTEREPVPEWLIKWGGIAWRLLVIGAVVYFAFEALRIVSVVIIAVVVAMFISAVLWVPVRWLIDRANWPHAMAALVGLLGGLLIFAGLVMIVVPALSSNFDTLSSDVADAYGNLQDWLKTGPLGLSQQRIDTFIDSATEQITSVRGQFLLGGATAVAEIVSGLLLAVIATFFILKDGRRVAQKMLGQLDPQRADDIEAALHVGRKTLTSYMGGVATVGFFDASIIAVGLLIVGVPLVLPLSILVFVGAFFPLVGAFVSGLVAVAVALVNGGMVDGLIILGVVIGVQQFEGHVILPVVYRHTMQLHPLVVLVGVAVGGVAFGLFGAFLAVPVIAVAVAIRETLIPDSEDTLFSLVRG